VEVVLSGEAGAVEAMLNAMTNGPPDARVDRLSTEDEPVSPPRRFAQRETV